MGGPGQLLPQLLLFMVLKCSVTAAEYGFIMKI